MKNNSAESRYQTWILRFWQETDSANWRAVLQNIETNQRHFFQDQQTMLTFLSQHLPNQSS